MCDPASTHLGVRKMASTEASFSDEVAADAAMSSRLLLFLPALLELLLYVTPADSGSAAATVMLKGAVKEGVTLVRHSRALQRARRKALR